jgi:hypothetical protein
VNSTKYNQFGFAVEFREGFYKFKNSKQEITTVFKNKIKLFNAVSLDTAKVNLIFNLN